MYCKDCGSEMAKEAAFCASCGKGQKQVIENTPFHWGPLIILAAAYFIFGYLGGDYQLGEVNEFDYIAGVMGLAAFIMTFVSVPKERTGLYITSIVLSILMMLAALGWIMSNT